MTPKILQSDLGLEFRGEVSAWCDEHEIKQVFSKSHSPQAQGLVEGINKLLRMKLRDAMVRAATRKWTTFLDRCVENWNNTPHAGQAHSPTWLYRADDDEFVEKRAEAVSKLEQRAQAKVAKSKAAKVIVGDAVRISLRALSSCVRQAIKVEKTSKYNCQVES